jgi:hypothetical protein
VVDPIERLRPYLKDDEQLLWQGVPDPEVRFSKVDAILLYLVVVYATGPAVAWYFALTHRGSASLYVIVAAGFASWIYFVGRFSYRRYSKPRTSYGITTTRVLIVGPMGSKEKLLQGQPVKVRRSRDSRHATVTIGANPRWQRNRPNKSKQELTFENVENPDVLLAVLAETGALLAP